jgi:hypothetical protein
MPILGCWTLIVTGSVFGEQVSPLSVWRSGSTSFECECGAKLTLYHQLDLLETDKPAETRAGALYR